MVPVAIYPYKEDPNIRKMRVQAWFQAVTDASKLTPRELERKFREDDGRKVSRSCIWDKYRRGQVVPRSGPRPDGGLNLVDRVEKAYPGTAKWLTLPLWRLADKAPMEMSEIRRCYENLPNLMKALFIDEAPKSGTVFWRANTKKRDYELLFKFADLNGFMAVLTMFREAQCCQDRERHKACFEMVLEYSQRLKHQPVTARFIVKLCSYLTQWFDGDSTSSQSNCKRQN